MLVGAVEAVLAGIEVPTEIVVIDDSDMPNRALADLKPKRACRLRYFWRESRGLSRANNDGITAALHDLLVFTQDDVLVTPTWFGTLVQAQIEAGPRAVVTGRVLPTEAEMEGGFAPSNVLAERPALYQGRIKQDVLYVQNMAMCRSAFDDIGPFDERLGPGTRYPASEDNDFCFRLLEADYRILYTPDAVVYHRAWRDETAYVPLRWQYGVSRGGYYAKYFDTRDRYMVLRMVTDVRDHLWGIPREIRRNRRRALGDTALAAGIVFGAARWLMTERRNRSTSV